MSDDTQQKSAATALKNTRRLVVKVGSALLLTDEGTIRSALLAGICRDLARWRANGVEIAIVTSGAMGLGRKKLGLSATPRLEEKQAAAAIGQPLLIQAWREALHNEGLETAQLLLTLDDTQNRRRYLNARATVETLLGFGVIPIVNENDTTATQELRYGDNDRLAAHVAQMSAADTLLILSDIDGLYDQDPRANSDAKHMGVVASITRKILAMAGGPNAGAGVGSGGMRTKLEAAQIANAAGCHTIIAQGDENEPLTRIVEGAKSTLFPADTSPDRARRTWIANHLHPAGTLQVDAGAAAALSDGASLLAAGLTGVDGSFDKGDPVSIADKNGNVLGQGLCAYESSELREIIGKRSSEIETILGYRRSAVVHRDNLALKSMLDGDTPQPANERDEP